MLVSLSTVSHRENSSNSSETWFELSPSRSAKVTIANAGCVSKMALRVCTRVVQNNLLDTQNSSLSSTNFSLKVVVMDREETLELYKQIVTNHSDIEIKGAKTPYTTVNGNMFSFIDDEHRLCFRFSEQRKEALKKEYALDDVVQYGAVMKGYVAVPQQVLEDRNLCRQLFSESFKFALNLKPKQTKAAKQA